MFCFLLLKRLRCPFYCLIAVNSCVNRRNAFRYYYLTSRKLGKRHFIRYIYRRKTKTMHESNSLEQLFATHYPRLLRIATAMLHDEEEARDVVSEVFERLVSTSSARLPKAEREGALLAAVRNRCIDRIRQMKVAERVKRRLPLDEADFPSWQQEDEYEQRMQAVSKAIGSELTSTQRRTLLLRYSEKKSYREIAETLNISEAAVYKHLRGALERLRKKLRK